MLGQIHIFLKIFIFSVQCMCIETCMCRNVCAVCIEMCECVCKNLCACVMYRNVHVYECVYVGDCVCRNVRACVLCVHACVGTCVSADSHGS